MRVRVHPSHIISTRSVYIPKDRPDPHLSSLRQAQARDLESSRLSYLGDLEKLRSSQRQQWRRDESATRSECKQMYIDTLRACSHVRREWRTEPESWCAELRGEPTMASLIVDEVNAGFWRSCA